MRHHPRVMRRVIIFEIPTATINDVVAVVTLNDGEK
jgi:hypothetical protein